jgi:hypothetical protein
LGAGGDVRTGHAKAITECFRLDAKGKIVDTQYRLLARESAFARHDQVDNPARPPAPAGNASVFFWGQQPADFNRAYRAGPGGACIPRYDSSGAQTGAC